MHLLVKGVAGMTTDLSPAGAMQNVATGQRLMIQAIVVNVVAYIVANTIEPIVGLIVGLLGFALALTGMVRTTSGLGFSTPRKTMYVIGLFLPLISLIVLAMASAEATKKLRANGYSVGLLGAKGV
jgi:hypothetical protein